MLFRRSKLLAVLAALAPAACGAPSVFIRVEPEKPRWSVREDPRFRVSIENRSSVPVGVCVCESAVETAAVMLDGRVLHGHILDSSPLNDPRYQWSSVRALLPGERAIIKKTGLTFIRVPETGNVSINQFLLGPGAYEVNFVYRYRGPSWQGQGRTLRRLVASNKAVFTVVAGGD